MPLSKQKQKEILKLKARAVKLVREGFSSRAVGEKIGKSHAWVINAVKELSAK